MRRCRAFDKMRLTKCWSLSSHNDGFQFPLCSSAEFIGLRPNFCFNGDPVSHQYPGLTERVDCSAKYALFSWGPRSRSGEIRPSPPSFACSGRCRNVVHADCCHSGMGGRSRQGRFDYKEGHCVRITHSTGNILYLQNKLFLCDHPYM